jgi:hypothetical protein
MPAKNRAYEALKEVARKEGVGERSERAIRLKNELNLILELVVNARESLQNEFTTEISKKQYSVDKAYLTKLKELTACFNSLTDSRIRLDKAEKAMEKEMTPQEEKEAVCAFVASLHNEERYHIIQRMWREHKAVRDVRGARGSDELPE